MFVRTDRCQWFELASSLICPAGFKSVQIKTSRETMRNHWKSELSSKGRWSNYFSFTSIANQLYSSLLSWLGIFTFFRFVSLNILVFFNSFFFSFLDVKFLLENSFIVNEGQKWNLAHAHWVHHNLKTWTAISDSWASPTWKPRAA